MQRVYTEDRSLDETMAVGDRDVVLVPKGYHPVGAPIGYDLYYLNAMAGPKRTWRFYNDPPIRVDSEQGLRLPGPGRGFKASSRLRKTGRERRFQKLRREKLSLSRSSSSDAPRRPAPIDWGRRGQGKGSNIT